LWITPKKVSKKFLKNVEKIALQAAAAAGIFYPVHFNVDK